MTTIVADGPAVTYAPPEEIAGWGGSPGPHQFFTTFTPPVPNGAALVFVYTGGFQDIDPLDTIDDVANPQRAYVVSLYQRGWTIITPGLTGNVPLGGTQGVYSHYGLSGFESFTGISWWERDMWLLVQKLVDDGVVDSSQIHGSGVSAAAISMMNIAWGLPEQFWIGGSSQIQQIPRFRAVHAHAFTGWWPAFRQNNGLLGWHLETALGTGTPPPSGELEQIPQSVQRVSNPWGRLKAWRDYYEAIGPGILPAPAPVFLEAIEPPTVGANGAFDAEGLPELSDAIDSEVTLHDYWFSWITKRTWDRYFSAWGRQNRLETLPGQNYPAPNDDHTAEYQSLVAASRNQGLVDWFERRRTGADEPEWTGVAAGPAPDPDNQVAGRLLAIGT